MNKTEFVEIIIPLADYYGRTLSDAAVQVYYNAAKGIDAAAFEHLIHLHLTDPEQGKFFPTLAHVVAQASNEQDVSRQAGLDFDNNPGVDGTGHHDLNHESTSERESRRRKHIATQVDGWKSASSIERIAYSDRVPDSLKGEMLMKLTHDSIQALESDNG